MSAHGPFLYIIVNHFFFLYSLFFHTRALILPTHVTMPFTFRRPEGEAGATWPAIAVGAFVAFGGVLFGYDTGTIGDILGMDYWLKLFANHIDPATGKPVLTSGQSSEIVSLLSVGTFFGALLSAPTGDLLGRKMGLMSWLVVFCVGVALQTAATAIPLFVAGRTIAGLGVGGLSALIPLYQSETAPKWIRGVIVGSYQVRKDTIQYSDHC